MRELRRGSRIGEEDEGRAERNTPVVIFVSGWSGPGFEWNISPIKRTLEEHFEVRTWQAPRNGWGDIRESARELSNLVFDLSFGEDKPVFLVGHSLGGLIAYEAAQISPAELVVSIASPHHGTTAAFLAPWSKSARQMRPYNPFVLDHIRKTPTSPLRGFLNVACKLDPICSASSSLHPFRTDEFLVDHGHLSVIFSGLVAERVSDFLIVKNGIGELDTL